MSETLWCTVCQRGVSGKNPGGKLKVGDYCPFCYEKQSMMGEYADYSNVARLRTTDDVAEEDRKLAELERMKKKIVRGQTTEDEKRKELELTIKTQSEQIASLTETVNKLVKK